MISTSTTAGNGTPALASAKESIRDVGRICVWKFVTAKYNPGNVIAKKDATYRRILAKLATSQRL